MDNKISLSVSYQFTNKQVKPDILAQLRRRALAKQAAGEICKRTQKVYTESDCDNIPYGWNWTNVQYTLDELHQHISRGDAFCVAQLKEKHRISGDFVSSQMIGIDSDRASIPVLMQNDFVIKYAGLLYPTASDSPELHKTRVIFPLDQPITNEREYRDLVLRVLGVFAEFGSMADEQCKDSVRLFFGSLKAAGNSIITDRILPIDVIKSLPLPTKQRPAEWYAKKGIDTARLMIQRSMNGHKHSELRNASILLGGYIEDGLLAESEAIAVLETEIERKADVADINGAYATIRDGIAYGKTKPITLAELEAQRQDYLKANGYAMNISPNGKTPNPPKDDILYKPTQDELRDRWLDTQDYIAFGLGDWRKYKSGLWQAEADSVIKRSVARIVEAAKVEGIKPNAALVNSVSEMARWEVDKGDSIWDSNSDYLVCRNGTLCIPDRVLGEHNPALYATSGVSFAYDPTAKAPAWEAFLFDLASSTSQAVVSFLQEFAGYSLTTDTRFELSIWLYGPPGSGKSTFLCGLEAMLGSRAGLLGLADIVSNRFALANLPGKTLAISTEQPGDYIASTHILNALISGESITVDIKFKPAIQITPRCKLAWAMNELPRVSDPNSGLFRRVQVVEFPVIPESERDPALKEAIKTEGAGILNWALDGLQRLRKRGRFEIPPEVKAATDSFKANNDIPARFVEECCITGNDQNGDPYRVSGSQLYEAYKTWCLNTGHKPMSSTSIATDWRRLKFEKYLAGGKAFWRYVGLKV